MTSKNGALDSPLNVEIQFGHMSRFKSAGYFKNYSIRYLKKRNNPTWEQFFIIQQVDIFSRTEFDSLKFKSGKVPLNVKEESIAKFLRVSGLKYLPIVPIGGAKQAGSSGIFFKVGLPSDTKRLEEITSKLETINAVDILRSNVVKDHHGGEDIYPYYNGSNIMATLNTIALTWVSRVPEASVEETYDSLLKWYNTEAPVGRIEKQPWTAMLSFFRQASSPAFSKFVEIVKSGDQSSDFPLFSTVLDMTSTYNVNFGGLAGFLKDPDLREMAPKNSFKTVIGVMKDTHAYWDSWADPDISGDLISARLVEEVIEKNPELDSCYFFNFLEESVIDPKSPSYNKDIKRERDYSELVYERVIEFLGEKGAELDKAIERVLLNKSKSSKDYISSGTGIGYRIERKIAVENLEGVIRPILLLEAFRNIDVPPEWVLPVVADSIASKFLK